MSVLFACFLTFFSIFLFYFFLKVTLRVCSGFLLRVVDRLVFKRFRDIPFGGVFVPGTGFHTEPAHVSFCVFQCSVTFWYGSGSADPYYRFTNPDPDPVLLVSGF
jgi:hypothetical protein